MAENVEQEQETATTPTSAPKSFMLFMRIMSKRRTWVCLFVLVYAILLSSSWNFLKSVLSWYKLQSQTSSSASGWPALYVSVLLGTVFGLLSMVAALAVAVPATLVIWIAVVVLLAFFGKPRRTLVIEGRKITREIVGFVFKILLKEGNIVAAVCAVLGYFALVRRNYGILLAGVGIGFGVMIAPVYIAEIAPTISRGSLTSFPEVFINLGILLGYVSNYAFSGFSAHINWRIMLAVGILPSVFIGFALFIIPESPRWLVMQNRVENPRSVLLKTNENEAEVDERLAEIQLAAGIGNAEKYEEKAVWRELLSPSPSICRMVVVGFGIQCFQQASGIDATVYYSPEILTEAGITDKSKLLAATVAVGVIKTAFILVATFLIDKLGRKPLLYVSTIGMTV